MSTHSFTSSVTSLKRHCLSSKCPTVETTSIHHGCLAAMLVEPAIPFCCSWCFDLFSPPDPRGRSTCHMFGGDPDLQKSCQKFGGSFPQTLAAPKHQNFGNSATWSEISPKRTQKYIVNCDHSRTCLLDLLNFGPQTSKTGLGIRPTRRAAITPGFATRLVLTIILQDGPSK